MSSITQDKNEGDRRGDAVFSGGPIAAFSGGWALIPFPGRIAHFWRKADHEVGMIGPRGKATMWESLDATTAATD